MGPTFSFRGIDNASYYILRPNDRRAYADYAGTGNTLNVAHPCAHDGSGLASPLGEVGRRRVSFDLAAVLGLERAVSPRCRVISALMTDPELSD